MVACLTPGSSNSLPNPGVWRATTMTCGMKFPNRFRNPNACTHFKERKRTRENERKCERRESARERGY